MSSLTNRVLAFARFDALRQGSRIGLRHGLIAVTLLGAMGLPGPVRAQDDPRLPRRMIFLPLGLDPLDFTDRAVIDLALHAMELPDERRAELYRLSAWVPVASSHAARLSFDYVGLEGDDRFQYGGGTTTIQWTSHLARPGRNGLALDIAGNLPMGDEELHPLSAKAPVLQARLRWSMMGGSGWRLWAGWWVRRVSPPSESNRSAPRSWFPSGSGFDLALHGSSPVLDWELLYHQDLGGLPDIPWLQATAAWRLADDIGLLLGVAASPGPVSRRKVDWLWTVGVRWRPAPLAGEDEGSGRRGPEKRGRRPQVDPMRS